ncbi:MAG: BTAD domain-containing putative transcriptional regulator, partial [Gemmatimonadota bacterium]|nr:BTAD domain-containing putative transcriptional regulator [Gemmatimonadota bacterium]
MIRLELLGPPELSVDGEPPPRELTWRKNLGLLVYLARSPRGQRSRDHLAEVFWPDRDEKDARHSLNEALRVVRKHLPDGALETEMDQVNLDRSALSMDADDFMDALEAADPHRAAMLIRGEFMEGFGIPESNAFEDWLSAERRSWRGHFVEVLVSVATAALEEGDLTTARLAADRARAVDALADAPVHISMECAALAGNPTSALARFRAFAEHLEQELGLEPPAALATLAERIHEQREIASDELRGEESALSRRLPLVGRGEALREALEAVRACRREAEPALLVVSGPPGSGKTRLGEEIGLRARLEGFDVAELRCDVGDREDPTDVIALAEDATERAPVLIWVDEAQQLDAEACAALAPTKRRFGDHPVAVLLTATSSPPSPALDELAARIGRDFPGHSVELSALSAADLARLARAVLPKWDHGEIERLARRLHRDTGGLPLLSVDMLHALRLGLELESEDEEPAPWPEPARTMDQTFPADIPGPLVAAIRVGFRRLSPEAQDVLKAGSLLTGRFTAEQLARGLEIEPDRLREALDELEWRRWLVAEPRGYDFVAQLHRTVVERDMMT